MSTEWVSQAELARSERVRLYVRDQLSAEQVAAFERELLASSELQDLVEAELCLREQAAEMPGTALEPPPSAAPSTQRAPALPRLAALAASLLVGIGIGFGSARLPIEPIAADLTMVSFTRARGELVPYHSAPAGRRIAARFLTADDSAHRLEIVDREGRHVLTREELHPDADGEVLLLLPALELSQSPLTITLSGAGREHRFELRLEP